MTKKEKKLQKMHPTDYILLIAQDLWQGRYQILSIILLKEFIKSNLNTDTMKKNVKFAELNAKIVTTFLKIQI